MLRPTYTIVTRVFRIEFVYVILLLAGITCFGYQYVDPRFTGIPVGIDIGNDLSYLEVFRNELIFSGRLNTWWHTAFHGLPLLGHPNTQIFYPPLILPVIIFGTEIGARFAYLFSLMLAGGGMYFLVRVLGPRPLFALWAGLIFSMSGGLVARIHAGHLQKVLGLPFLPLIIACTILVGRAESLRWLAFWATLTGILHGTVFLAGDTSISLCLLLGIPILFLINVTAQNRLSYLKRLVWCHGFWIGGLVAATSAKLLAALVVLSGTSRSVDPYFGSQDAYWSIIHLVFPFFADVRGLESLSYGSGQVNWGWGWWEYTQYIGVIPGILAVAAVLLIADLKRRDKLLGPVQITVRELLACLGILILASFWLANAKVYSPVHWLFEVISPLQSFRVPSRALIMGVPVVLALASVGLELSGIRKNKCYRLLLVLSVVGGICGVWWVNSSWLTPLSWVCSGIPILKGLGFYLCSASFLFIGVVSSCSLVYLAIRTRQMSWKPFWCLTVSLIIIISLADIYHSARQIPKVAEISDMPALNRVINELKNRDSGPFLVGLGNSDDGYAGRNGMYVNTAARLAFAEQGITVADDVSPLVPINQDRHRLFPSEKRMRYRVGPSNMMDSMEHPYGSSTWIRIMKIDGVTVLRNTQAHGDAWSAKGGFVKDIDLIDWSPGRFVVRADVKAGWNIIVPANFFKGWKVSVDSSEFIPATEFDGYVSTESKLGVHQYEFIYKAPMLPIILILGLLPWGIICFMIIVGVRRIASRVNYG